jgi:hypothetical protein
MDYNEARKLAIRDLLDDSDSEFTMREIADALNEPTGDSGLAQVIEALTDKYLEQANAEGEAAKRDAA